MILITCPNCGPRNSSEFAYFGETKPRPAVNETDLAEWSSYLFMKRNPAGWTTEHWYHREGCRTVPGGRTRHGDERDPVHEHPGGGSWQLRAWCPACSDGRGRFG